MNDQETEAEAACGQSRLTAGLGMAITCDASPLLLFAKILEAALQGRERLFDLGNLGFELARVESGFCAAGTGETLVRLYPSDAFLRFATTVFAGDFDLELVHDSSHVHSLMPNVELRGCALLRSPA